MCWRRPGLGGDWVRLRPITKTTNHTLKTYDFKLWNSSMTSWNLRILRHSAGDKVWLVCITICQRKLFLAWKYYIHISMFLPVGHVFFDDKFDFGKKVFISTNFRYACHCLISEIWGKSIMSEENIFQNDNDDIQ